MASVAAIIEGWRLSFASTLLLQRSDVKRVESVHVVTLAYDHNHPPADGDKFRVRHSILSPIGHTDLKWLKAIRDLFSYAFSVHELIIVPF